ncbi:MAG: hypothetical protein IID44_27050 [Planctomycetes bacterium]|nr:hypothetical protein [Planctomycetota bacterium]
MTAAVDSRVVTWRVRYIDRASKKLYDRDLLLDETRLGKGERDRLSAILDREHSGLEILKYRQFFKEVSENTFAESIAGWTAARVPIFFVNTIMGGIEYFEDELGNPLDAIGLVQIMSGTQNPIILGNPTSVLRLGPANIKERDQWTSDTADKIAHFLYVVDEIVKSDWVRGSLSISFQGSGITGFKHPGRDSTHDILFFVRQLLSECDDVLNSACNAYLAHVDHMGKSWWVMATQSTFNNTRKSTVFPNLLDPYTVEEVIDMVTYGTGVTHRKSRAKWEEKFPHILREHGRERVVFAFQAACRHLLSDAFRLAPVIEQDYRHWIDDQDCSTPDRVTFSELLE